MTCWSTKRRITDYVDGRLRGTDRSRVAAHLAQCETCYQQMEDFACVRSTLRDLRESVPPAGLRTELLVIASQVRETASTTRLERLWNRWKLRVNEIMRPLTIPATGGLLSSFILFAVLAMTISASTRVAAYEVPVMYANTIDANLVPVQLRSAVVLTFSLDDKGRITDYAVQDGSASFVGDPGRLQQNNIACPSSARCWP
jgi:anti-sigma factor RsiW